MFSETQVRAIRWSKNPRFSASVASCGEFGNPKTVKVSLVLSNRWIRHTVGAVIDRNNNDILVSGEFRSVID
jgi:hypothetical protein